MRAHPRVISALLGGALLLGACTPGAPGSGPSGSAPASAGPTSPLPAGTGPTAVDASGLWLPQVYEGEPLIDPGWATPAQYRDGVYLAAGERTEALEFTAIDIHGEVLWRAPRPLTCTGFALSTDAAGSAIAVLTDVAPGAEAGDALASTTASGYDLATGQLRWGPVPVPGPHVGPGLVFAAPASGAMGAFGPRVVLSPDTGEVIADEATGARIVGEYDSTVLTAADGALIASAASAGRELWRLPLAERGWDAEALAPKVGEPVGGGLALVTTSPAGGVLLDLSDGSVLQEDVLDATVDLTTGVVISQDATSLRALDQERAELWRQGIAPGTRLSAAGGALLYVLEGAAVRAHNVITGAVAQAYDPDGGGDIAVPSHISEYGGAVLITDLGQIIATVPAG